MPRLLGRHDAALFRVCDTAGRWPGPRKPWLLALRCCAGLPIAWGARCPPTPRSVFASARTAVPGTVSRSSEPDRRPAPSPRGAIVNRSDRLLRPRLVGTAAHAAVPYPAGAVSRRQGRATPRRGCAQVSTIFLPPACPADTRAKAAGPSLNGTASTFCFSFPSTTASARWVS